jgi:hypothetical protein
MGVSAIAIPIKVATTPIARFTVFTSAVRLDPFLTRPGFSLLHGARNAGPDGVTVFPGKYS